jgi:pyruvate,water dikinase
MAGYASPVDCYVDRLAEGIATLTAAFAPNAVIVRLSDFKSNEYANLIGGSQYEPHEENPMIGFRGDSRYVDPLLADWLMDQGIESVSLNPDTVVDTWLRLARIKEG